MMSAVPPGEPWAQVVCTSDIHSEASTINKETFSFGRSKKCDVSLPDNRHISGNHCHIEVRDGVVYLCDTSTNGTVLVGERNSDEDAAASATRLNKLLNRERHRLQHGDEIFLVQHASKPELAVSYIFEDLNMLRDENSEVVSSNDTSGTLELLSDREEVGLDVRKTEPPDKKVKLQDVSESEDEDCVKKGEELEGRSGGEWEGGSREAGVAGELHDEEGVGDGVGGAAAAGDASPVAAQDKKDAMEETLLCCICQEILHDCISLQPCMHCFCSGCYSDWMARSRDCPSCRNRVDRISKNHIVNNLVDAYLQNHPEKKRPQEDIDELEAKNKITKDMVYPKRKLRVDCDDDDDDGSSIPSDTEDEDSVPLPAAAPFWGVHCGFQNPFGLFNTNMAAHPRCRQCPPDNVPTAGRQCAGAGTSTAAAGGGQAFVCPRLGARHMMCQCCWQPMPDRRAIGTPTAANVPKQNCSLCQRIFCHLYWGCQRNGCSGCLNRFSDMVFEGACLNTLVLNNQESYILQEYLRTSGKTMNDVLTTCLDKLQSDTYNCPDKLLQQPGLNGDTVICYSCALKNMKELAYQYRRDLEPADLPADMRNRPDCYWGRNCRTQHHNFAHARKYNHVCEQTRNA